MENLFQFGEFLRQNMKEKGWKIKGKSWELLLDHEARKLITLGYAGQDVSEEEKNTIIAGILNAWSGGEDGV